LLGPGIQWARCDGATNQDKKIAPANRPTCSVQNGLLIQGRLSRYRRSAL